MNIWMILVGLLTILTAFGVISAVRPLHSAICLVLTLLLIAVHFALLQAHFLAAMQVMIYAGAIMVLVIFVIMLLGIEKDTEDPSKRPINLAIALVTGAFFSVLGWVISKPGVLTPLANLEKAPVVPVDGSVKGVGQVLFGEFLFPFELASVLLLAAAIGAVMLAKEPTRELPAGRGLKAKHPSRT